MNYEKAPETNASTAGPNGIAWARQTAIGIGVASYEPIFHMLLWVLKRKSDEKRSLE